MQGNIFNASETATVWFISSRVLKESFHTKLHWTLSAFSQGNHTNQINRFLQLYKISSTDNLKVLHHSLFLCLLAILLRLLGTLFYCTDFLSRLAPPNRIACCSKTKDSGICNFSDLRVFVAMYLQKHAVIFWHFLNIYNITVKGMPMYANHINKVSCWEKFINLSKYRQLLYLQPCLEAMVSHWSQTPTF